MHAPTATHPVTQPRLAPVLAVPARREPAGRDFGTGYGRSSGYAAARAYVPAAGLARFRFG